MLQVGSTVSFGEKKTRKKRLPGPLSPPGATFFATFLQVTQLMACPCGLCFAWSALLPLRPCHSSNLGLYLGDQLSLIKEKTVACLTKGSVWFNALVGKDLQNPTCRDGKWTQKKGNEKLSRPVHPAARHFLLKMQIMLDTLGLCWPMLELYM